MRHSPQPFAAESNDASTRVGEQSWLMGKRLVKKPSRMATANIVKCERMLGRKRNGASLVIKRGGRRRGVGMSERAARLGTAHVAFTRR